MADQQCRKVAKRHTYPWLVRGCFLLMLRARSALTGVEMRRMEWLQPVLPSFLPSRPSFYLKFRFAGTRTFFVTFSRSRTQNIELCYCSLAALCARPLAILNPATTCCTKEPCAYGLPPLVTETRCFSRHNTIVTYLPALRVLTTIPVRALLRCN